MSGELVAIARVGRAHGVRGDFRVWPFAQDSETLFHVEEIQVHPAQGEPLTLHLERCRPAPGGKCLLATVREIRSREQVRDLVDALIYVRPDQLLETDEDTWYHRDLLELPVQLADGTVLGVVEEILDNGGHDTLVIRDHDAGLEYQIPFVGEMVQVEERRLLATPPEGLLEATRARIKRGRKP